MKKPYLLALVLFATLSAHAVVADTTLIRFDLTHFEDWTYHRAGVDLTYELISRNEVNLLTTEAGEQVTLESPVMNCVGMDSLKILVDYRPHEPYTPSKVALQMDLLDAEREVVATTTCPVGKDLQQAKLEAVLPVPGMAQPGEYVLLLSAPRADKDNCAAVYAVKVWAVTADDAPLPRGDINGDGVVDVSDVNLAINVMLGKEQDATIVARADMDGNGSVDVSDINLVINAMLGKVQ